MKRIQRKRDDAPLSVGLICSRNRRGLWPQGFVALVAVALTLLAGCKYSRLLAFKNSLRNSAENVHFVEANGLFIEFDEPILQPEDVEALGYRPSLQASGQGDELAWEFSFVTGDQPEKPAAFAIRLLFRHHKLVRAQLSPELRGLVSDDLQRQVFLALGAATVDWSSGQLHFGAREERLRLRALPTYDDVCRAWGPGVVTDIDERQFAAVYRFHCVGADHIQLAIKGIFRKHTNAMLAGEIVFGRNQVDFSEDTVVIRALK